MANDSVTVAFGLMFSELEGEIDALNSEGARLFHESKYDEAENQIQKGRALTRFVERVRVLQEEWSRDFADDFPEEVVQKTVLNASRKIMSNSKSSKTTLLVRFPDGTVISEKNAADTFALVLKRIGFERVRSLGRVVNGEPLVSNDPSKKYNDKEIDGLYVKTHSSTSSKSPI
jgi:hypothetical protein